jgi:hypothetical protein
MTHSFRLQLILAFLICFFSFFFSFVKGAIACDCPLITPEKAFERADIIVSGKIVGAEYRKGIISPMMESVAKDNGIKLDYEVLVLKVQVDKWWKGDAPEEIYLVMEQTKNADGTSTQSSCDYSFNVGGNYLIYASKREGFYRTGACSRTQKLSQATKDLEILGAGKKPIRNTKSNNT